MSDRPPRKNDQPDSESPPSGGWRTPQTPGTWRKPEKTGNGGWQVPALPEELDQQPASTGAWHLPKPENTTFTPEDKLPVNVPAEEVLLPGIDASAVQTPSPAGVPAPTAGGLTPEDELLNIVTSAADEAERQREADTPKKITPQAPEDVLFMLEKLEDDEPDDEDTFSMSELVALASLVDEEPKPGITPGASAPLIAPVLPPPTDEDKDDIPTSALSPAEKALLNQTQAGSATAAQPVIDPGDYARQQLAALEGGSTLSVSAPLDAPLATPDTPDPGDYARQQLAALGGTDIPLPPSPLIDARQEELARRFRETEDEVRSLRARVQNGQLTQQQFEEQLHNLMILDDDQVYWVMGAETDQWYKFVNNEWVVAEPPRAPSGSGFTLPTLDSQPQPAASQTEYSNYGNLQTDDPFAPIPRAGVSTSDINMTQVGPSYLKSELAGEPITAAPTVQNIGYGSQPTVAGQTVMSPSAAAYGGAIASPVDTSQPPDLSEFEEEAPTYEEAAAAYRNNMLRNIVLAAAVILGLVLIAGVGFIVLALNSYNNTVSRYEANIAGLASYQPAFQTVVIQDYQGRELARLSQSGEERISVELSQISPFLIHAIVSTQNPTFFEDPGWDTGATIGAFFNPDGTPITNTITQQVTRALVVQDDTVPDSELRLVAGALTERYSKDFILKIYLNEFPFGNQTYGVEAASQFYFQKSAKDLNLSEAAMLATVFQNPVNNDLVTNPDYTFDQFELVLLRMAEVGCLNFTSGQRVCINQNDITSPQTINDKARVRDPRRYRPREFDTKYPHFITLVQQQLESAFTPGLLYSSGFVVKTTFVPELQDYVQNRLNEQLRTLAPSGVTTGAVMITDPTSGAIRVYVGSPDFYNEANKGQNDYARIYQQPGAIIKPLVYAAALEGVDRNSNGTSTDLGEYYTPASILWDVPTNFSSTPPIPASVLARAFGAVPLRIALQGNYNIAPIKVLESIGLEKFVDTSTRMGIRWAESSVFGLSTAIGTTEVRLFDMMVAYGTIANGGNRVPLFAIESITDRNGNDVRVPDTLRAPSTQEAIPSSVAFLLQSIMSDDSARGLSGAIPINSDLTLPNLEKNGWVGAMAGTSDGNRDLWTIGFVSNAVVGVWLGHPDDATIRDQTGLTAAAPLWNRIMTQMVNTSRPRPVRFPQPDSVTSISICPDTGSAAGGPCTSQPRNEVFALDRRPPDAGQGLIMQATINTWTQLLANEFCNQPEDRVIETFVNIPDPAALAWLNTPAGRPTAQRLGLPAVIESPPVASCDVNTQTPTANIVSPSPNQTLQGEVPIIGQVSAPANFNRYQMEYAPLNSTNFQTIGGFSQQQQPNPNSTLATWDTTTVPNGQYTLRLTVFSNEGGFIYRTVMVTVDNPLPTATPTLMPTNTVEAAFTPLPFDTPIPLGGGPTPTIDTSGN